MDDAATATELAGQKIIAFEALNFEVGQAIEEDQKRRHDERLERLSEMEEESGKAFDSMKQKNEYGHKSNGSNMGELFRNCH